MTNVTVSNGVAPTPAKAPELSVVVPAVNTMGDVINCLEALEDQRVDLPDLEVLLVNRLGHEVSRQVGECFGTVQLLDVPESTTIPEMRATAFRAATGDHVAVIEDHVVVPLGWGRRMIDALDEEKVDVVGGAVENAATETLMDWACFLCEYSHLIPPIQEGDVPGVTGNNVIYRRSTLMKFEEAWTAGKWENHLHDAMRAAGVTLFCRPDIVVGHKKHYTFEEYLTQRYYYARSYAAARVKDAPLSTKLFYGAACAALPPVLFQRTVLNIAKKRKHLGLLAKSTPLIGAFVTSWAAGEIVGSLAGDGGSLSKVC